MKPKIELFAILKLQLPLYFTNCRSPFSGFYVFLSGSIRFRSFPSHGSDGWIRTNEMQESKPCALPLGYIAILIGNDITPCTVWSRTIEFGDSNPSSHPHLNREGVLLTSTRATNLPSNHLHPNRSLCSLLVA